jgi:hypothetical protein
MIGDVPLHTYFRHIRQYNDRLAALEPAVSCCTCTLCQYWHCSGIEVQHYSVASV